MSKQPPQIVVTVFGPILVWVMLCSGLALVVFTILNIFDLGLGTELRNAIFFGLVGTCLMAQGLLLFYVNYYKEKDFEAAAPYAGRRKVSKTAALLVGAVLAIMGLASLGVAFSVF